MFIVVVVVVVDDVDVDFDFDVNINVLVVRIVIVGMGRPNIKVCKPCLYPLLIIWRSGSGCIMALIDKALPVVFTESLSLLLLLLLLWLSVLLLRAARLLFLFDRCYCWMSDAVATSFLRFISNILLSLKRF